MDEDFDLAVEHGQLLVGLRFAQSILVLRVPRHWFALTVNLLHRRSRLIELTTRNDLLLKQRFAFEIGLAFGSCGLASTVAAAAFTAANCVDNFVCTSTRLR